MVKTLPRHIKRHYGQITGITRRRNAVQLPHHTVCPNLIRVMRFDFFKKFFHIITQSFLINFKHNMTTVQTNQQIISLSKRL
jgi:hypothetical protein